MTKFVIAPTHVYTTATGIEANGINEQLKKHIDDLKEKLRLDMYEVYDMSTASRLELGSPQIFNYSGNEKEWSGFYQKFRYQRKVSWKAMHM